MNLKVGSIYAISTKDAPYERVKVKIIKKTPSETGNYYLMFRLYGDRRDKKPLSYNMNHGCFYARGERVIVERT